MVRSNTPSLVTAVLKSVGDCGGGVGVTDTIKGVAVGVGSMTWTGVAETGGDSLE